MRIALVSEYFYPTLGGIQESLYYVCRELIRRGHKPTIITGRIPGAGPVSRWWPKGLPVEIYHPLGLALPYFANGAVGRSTAGFFLGRRLRSLLQPEHFDLVHIQSPCIGILPILANHYSRVPVCGTLHTSFSHSHAMTLLRPLVRRHFDRLNAVIGVSPVSLVSMRRYCDFEGEVIPNGVDTSLFRPVELGTVDDRFPQLNDGKLNIFFIGRADPRNGLETLIRAFAKLHSKVSHARLVIAGGGIEMARCRRLAESLIPQGAQDWYVERESAPKEGLTSPAVFLGPVRDSRARLYRSCHIQVFNVERASCPVTLLEGMSSGLAVVCSDFEGHSFLGEAGRHFVTSGFGNVDEVHDRLLELALQPSERQRIGSAARARALQLDWSVITDQLVGVYQRVLNESNQTLQTRL